MQPLQHDTPKYGLIYHASLIGQAAPKHKGKISRVLAAKCALATRVDALADDTDTSIGIESRAKVREKIGACSSCSAMSFVVAPTILSYTLQM